MYMHYQLIRKQEKIIDTFELWCWRRLLRIPRTLRSTNKQVIEEIDSTNPLEALITKQQFGHIMRRDNSLEKLIMLGMVAAQEKYAEYEHNR